jgi:hypothetical protein
MAIGDLPTTEELGAAGAFDSPNAYASPSGPFGDLSTSDALGLGVGALGLGSILARGEPSLPPQFGQMEQMVPGLQQNAADLYGRGTALYGQGREALGMAQRGELTKPQAAELKNYSTGLQNISNQMFASMGRDVTKDTSAIGAQAFIDSQVNAMAQKEIQTTIQLGFGELSAASQFTQESLGYSQAAANILMQAGKAQLDADKAYSDSLTSAFASFAKIAGAVLA